MKLYKKNMRRLLKQSVILVGLLLLLGWAAPYIVRQMIDEPIGTPHPSVDPFALRFATQEEEVSFRNGDTPLAGTLVLPMTPGPHPAVVVLGGSNWNTRDQTRYLAALLAPRGVATLIYDKRGYGTSKGERIVPFATTAGDAIAAVRYLRSRTDIHAKQIGLSGTSRGGWHAPLAASLSEDVAFLVLFGAPATTPAEQELARTEQQMRADEFPETEIRQAVEFMQLKFDYSRGNARWQDYIAARKRARDKSWFGEYAGGPDAEDSRAWKWMRMNMDYDPTPALQKVTCPVLAFFGEVDRVVPPEQNVPPMEAALQEAGNGDYTLQVIPSANHALRPAETGGRKERSFLPRGWAAGVEELLVDWLATHLDIPY